MSSPHRCACADRRALPTADHAPRDAARVRRICDAIHDLGGSPDSFCKVERLFAQALLDATAAPGERLLLAASGLSAAEALDLVLAELKRTLADRHLYGPSVLHAPHTPRQLRQAAVNELWGRLAGRMAPTPTTRPSKTQRLHTLARALLLVSPSDRIALRQIAREPTPLPLGHHLTLHSATFRARAAALERHVARVVGNDLLPHGHAAHEHATLGSGDPETESWLAPFLLDVADHCSAPRLDATFDAARRQRHEDLGTVALALTAQAEATGSAHPVYPVRGVAVARDVARRRLSMRTQTHAAPFVQDMAAAHRSIEAFRSTVTDVAAFLQASEAAYAKELYAEWRSGDGYRLVSTAA